MVHCMECHRQVKMMECPSCGELCCSNCYRERASRQEKPMNHSRLVEEARAAARRINDSLDAEAICTLALIVEQQDVTIARLSEAADKPDPVRAELVAACVTCDEATQKIRTMYPMLPTCERKLWDTLYAAGERAGRAAKLAEPKGDHVDAASQPSEPPGYAEFRERAKTVVEAGSQVSREEALEMIDAECGEPGIPTPPGYTGPELPRIIDVVDGWVTKCNQIRDQVITLRSTMRNVVRAHRFSKPAPPIAIEAARRDDEFLRRLQEIARPPPIEIEMRVVDTCDKWTWEIYLVGRWTLARQLEDERVAYFPGPTLAQDNGDAWLAALSRHLGVPLEGKWEAKVNNEAKCQRCGRPVERIRGEIPTSCSGCASDF